MTSLPSLSLYTFSVYISTFLPSQSLGSGLLGSRPETVARTDENGGFAVELPGGGKYYLGARSRHGGPRQPGEWAGKLAGTPDSGLEVLDGRIVKGLTIVMEQVW